MDSLLDLFGLETEEQRQIRTLEAMDDHDLADLGISRDQIPAFVRGQVLAKEPG